MARGRAVGCLHDATQIRQTLLREHYRLQNPHTSLSPQPPGSGRERERERAHIPSLSSHITSDRTAYHLNIDLPPLKFLCFSLYTEEPWQTALRSRAVLDSAFGFQLCCVWKPLTSSWPHMHVLVSLERPGRSVEIGTRMPKCVPVLL